MFAEFEEKIYESYFNNELDRRSSIYFPLGQVQEGVLGMDSVAYSNNRRLWSSIGYPSHYNKSGEDLKAIAEEMESHLNAEVNNIPSLKINLIFQYKRPEYMMTANAGQWTLWGNKYYRYEIYEKQQELLSYVEQYLGNKALVLYASPVLHELDNLIEVKKNNRIIESSNFKKASELARHHYNTYIRSGTYSIACSDPEKIEHFDLLEDLKNRTSDQGHDDAMGTNSMFIREFSEQVETIYLENQTYRRSYRMLLEDYHSFGSSPLLFSFIKMKIIREISGVQWLVAY